MARTLSEDDQDWLDVARREESPERVSLPAWGWLALALKVTIHGDPVPRAPDTWLEVEGRWQERTGDDPNQPFSGTPLLLAEAIRVIEQPSSPYENGFPY